MTGLIWQLLHSQAVDYPTPLQRIAQTSWLPLRGGVGGCGYQVLRFTPTRLRSDGADAVHVSSIRFRSRLGPIRTCEATAANPGGQNPSSHGPQCAVDESDETSWVDNHKLSLVVQFPYVMDVDAYSFTSAGDRPDCDPIQWRLEGVRVGSTWTLLHSQADGDAMPPDRSVCTDWLPLLDGGALPRDDEDFIEVRQDAFERRCCGVAFLRWEDLQEANGERIEASAGDSPSRPRAGLRKAGAVPTSSCWRLGCFCTVIVCHLVAWCLLVGLGLLVNSGVGVAATITYCMLLQGALKNGWLPPAGLDPGIPQNHAG